MPNSEIESQLATAARVSIILIGGIAVIGVLEYAQVILAPISLAVVIGLMFGQLADRIERFGIPPWVSALAVVLIFLALIGIAATGFAVPLADWMDRLPAIWSRLQSELTSWKGIFASVGGLQEQLRQAMGQNSGMKVNVDDTSAVESVVYFAPTLMAQVVLFLASMYFFIATRNKFLDGVLSRWVGPRLRHRLANTFLEVENKVSRYLLSITMVNTALGLAASAVLFVLGVPSPFLWGLMAGVLNYVIYIGPAVMVLILTGVGLATADSAPGILLPPIAYLGLNLIEAQFVTPHVLGHTMTLNPFLVFLTLAGWIWLWGPVGGFIAVPALLIAGTVIANIAPEPSQPS